MTETAKPKNKYELTPAEILDGLANNMRMYDQLVAQKEPLLARRNQNSHKLEEYDFSEDWPEYPPDVAFSALNLHITEKRLALLEKSIRELEHDYSGILFLRLGHLKGKKIEVISTDPEQRQIGAFYLNQSRLLDYSGKSYTARKGKVSDLNLTPAQGGFIQFEGRARIYQAGPLIDRENDYRPAFTIELI